MEKILISLPDDLAVKFRATIPARQRSKVIARLVRQEFERQDKTLQECAKAVESDSVLHQEMQDWNTRLADGLADETW